LPSPGLQHSRANYLDQQNPEIYVWYCTYLFIMQPPDITCLVIILDIE
jgi:hypothetical protein